MINLTRQPTKAEIQGDLDEVNAVQDEIADVLEDEDLDERGKLEEIERLIFEESDEER